MFGKKLFLVVITSMLLAGGMVVATHDAEAAPGGRAQNRGYFTNNLYNPNTMYFGDVIVGGVPATTNKAQFISFVEGKLGGSSQDRTGAAFIIQTMRGAAVGWDRERPPSAADIQDWRNRINDPAVTITLQNYGIDWNSAYHSGTNDDLYYWWPEAARYSLVFRVNGAVAYVLKQDCANPIGEFGGLPTPDRAPEGWVDSANCTTLVGWARDWDYMARGLDIEVFIDGPWYAAAAGRMFPYQNGGSGGGRTDIYRGDIGSNGHYGFRIDLTTIMNLMDGNSHTVYVYAHGKGTNGANNGNNPQLLGSPATVGPCYNYGLIPQTEHAGTGSTVEYGTSSVTFDNSVIKSGTTVSRPTQLVTKRIIYSPGTNKNTPVSHVDAVASNCDSRWAVGANCVSDISVRNGHVFPAASQTYPAPSPVNQTTISITGYPVGTRVCAGFALSPYDQDPSHVGRWGAFSCITIVAKPIVTVNGGDVAAGGEFVSGGLCNTGSSTAAIASWPNATNTAAGTQFGAFALGRITGFATAKINNSPATPPRALTFANTSGSGEDYGGGFGPVPCIADHWGAMPSDTSTIGVGGLLSLATGSFELNANQTPVTGMLLLPGVKKVVYVDGDLRIRNDIRYLRFGWSSVDNIPAIKFVVRGDIYIDKNVTQLDGIYIAQPNGGSGGNIYTCADGVNAIDVGNNTSSSLFSECDTPLTVNGVFAAKQVHLLRTAGTAMNGTSAEHFNYLPELWQAQWPADNTGSSTKYDSITSLPPVL